MRGSDGQLMMMKGQAGDRTACTTVGDHTACTTVAQYSLYCSGTIQPVLQWHSTACTTLAPYSRYYMGTVQHVLH